MRVERLFSIEHADEATWRALEPQDFPFFDFEFLRALERSSSVGRASGWLPSYLVCKDEGRTLGALCLYLKTDRFGEYIFDWEWARAYREHGLPYYPKLVAAVPFTPATGPKLLVRPELEEDGRATVARTLLGAARQLGDELRVSSTHALFLPEEELGEVERGGYAIRHSLQFHWRDRGYDAFSDYLSALGGKRRRQITRERRQIGGRGLVIERLRGASLTREDADAMYRFYLATYDRKWGSPYLTQPFFREVFRTMGDRSLLVMARDGLTRRPLAGALYFFKGSSLYGR